MIILKSTHNRVVEELEKDIELREGIISNLRKEKVSLKTEVTNERAIRKASDKLLKEKLSAATSDLAEANYNNLELDKKIKELEWCIKERDKAIKDLKEDNLRIYKKLEFNKEMYRQFKEKCDKAMEIQFVTRTIKESELKKFLKIDDVLSLYTLVGMAGK